MNKHPGAMCEECGDVFFCEHLGLLNLPLLASLMGGCPIGSYLFTAGGLSSGKERQGNETQFF